VSLRHSSAKRVLDAGSIDCSPQPGTVAHSEVHASHAGGCAGSQQGAEARRVDKCETVGVDSGHRSCFQGVDDGRHEALDTGRIERALHDDGGIARWERTSMRSSSARKGSTSSDVCPPRLRHSTTPALARASGLSWVERRPGMPVTAQAAWPTNAPHRLVNT
jgi:hypothetical protein